jgi:hypothetical protein
VVAFSAATVFGTATSFGLAAAFGVAATFDAAAIFGVAAAVAFGAAMVFGTATSFGVAAIFGVAAAVSWSLTCRSLNSNPGHFSGFIFIFVSFGESCLLVSWCAGGRCGRAGSTTVVAGV